jgi:predicted dehydrogenase
VQRNRRDFIKQSFGLTAVASAAPMFVPSSAFGANDRMAYGVIGVGGRGRYLNRYFLKAGCQCVATCDVYEPNLEEAAKDSPQAKKYIDYEELLQQSGLDFVVVGTPDHQHAPNLYAALKAKKDVYLEKPMSHSLAQSVEMVKAVRASKQIVQVGMQRRSAEVIHLGKQIVDSGRLGRITLAKPQWHWNTSQPLNNNPLPGKLHWEKFRGASSSSNMQPMKFRRWRLFWDFSGGNMTDQGTHLMDVVQWYTNNNPPQTALCAGQIAKSDGAEAPDVFSSVFEFPRMMANWTLDYCNSYQNGWSITLMGDEGTMILDEDGFTVFKEPWRPGHEPVMQVKLPVPIEPHIANFLDCVKSRKDPNAPVEVGMRAVAGPHLANIAYKQKRQVRLAEDLRTVS